MNLRPASDVAALTGGAITDREFQRRARLGDIPLGVVVRIGRRVFFNEERFVAWLEAGGAALPGGWRRQPRPAEVAPAGVS